MDDATNKRAKIGPAVSPPSGPGCLAPDVVVHMLQQSMTTHGYAVIGVARQVCTQWRASCDEAIRRLFVLTFQHDERQLPSSSELASAHPALREAVHARQLALGFFRQPLQFFPANGYQSDSVPPKSEYTVKFGVGSFSGCLPSNFLRLPASEKAAVVARMCKCLEDLEAMYRALEMLECELTFRSLFHPTEVSKQIWTTPYLDSVGIDMYTWSGSQDYRRPHFELRKLNMPPATLEALTALASRVVLHPASSRLSLERESDVRQVEQLVSFTIFSRDFRSYVDVHSYVATMKLDEDNEYDDDGEQQYVVSMRFSAADTENQQQEPWIRLIAADLPEQSSIVLEEHPLYGKDPEEPLPDRSNYHESLYPLQDIALTQRACSDFEG